MWYFYPEEKKKTSKAIQTKCSKKFSESLVHDSEFLGFIHRPQYKSTPCTEAAIFWFEVLMPRLEMWTQRWTQSAACMTNTLRVFHTKQCFHQDSPSKLRMNFQRLLTLIMEEGTTSSLCYRITAFLLRTTTTKKCRKYSWLWFL